MTRYEKVVVGLSLVVVCAVGGVTVRQLVPAPHAKCGDHRLVAVPLAMVGLHIAGACGGDEDRPPPPPAPPLLPFPDVTQHFLKHQNHFNPPYGIEGEYEEDAQELVAAGASGNGGIWGCIPATDNPESPSARTGYYDPITGGFAIVQFEEIKTYFPINISQWDRFCDRGQT